MDVLVPRPVVVHVPGVIKTVLVRVRVIVTLIVGAGMIVVVWVRVRVAVTVLGLVRVRVLVRMWVLVTSLGLVGMGVLVTSLDLVGMRVLVRMWVVVVMAMIVPMLRGVLVGKCGAVRMGLSVHIGMLVWVIVRMGVGVVVLRTNRPSVPLPRGVRVALVLTVPTLVPVRVRVPCAMAVVVGMVPAGAARMLVAVRLLLRVDMLVVMVVGVFVAVIVGALMLVAVGVRIAVGMRGVGGAGLVALHPSGPPARPAASGRDPGSPWPDASCAPGCAAARRRR